MTTLGSVLGTLAVLGYGAVLWCVCTGLLAARRWLLEALLLGTVLAHLAAALWMIAGLPGASGLAWFGFGNSLSLMLAVLGVIVAVTCMGLRLERSFVLLAPLSALAILYSMVSPDAAPIAVGPGLRVHIPLAISAFGCLLAAALYAAILWVEHERLKAGQFGAMRQMPPLEAMEMLLFRFLWAGEILLTAAIVSGLLFGNILDGALLPKTLFSIAAWVIYGALLCGRQLRGWRGRQAAQMTLLASACLLLAYFGNKVLPELASGV